MRRFIFLALALGLVGSGIATTTMPVITCHNDFNVTIESGSWELIAVEGYELLNQTDPECVSQTKFGSLHFDIQLQCQGQTMQVFNNTYTFTLRARQEWLVETSEDRLIDMKCEYHLTGEGQFVPAVTVQQVHTVESEVSATQATFIAGARLLLVNARDDDDVSDGVWATLDAAQVGQKVRLVVDTTMTPTHSQYPYIGVKACYFYDVETSSAFRFDMINDRGCASPPSYYDPFKAAGTPFVNGMLFNRKPVDDATANAATNPVTDASGYLTGDDQPGMAYSDVFKIFKFPGSNVIRAKCKIRFCVEKNDPDCITPNCNGRLYTGLYALGGYDSVFRRKRRSILRRKGEEEEEERKEERRRSPTGGLGDGGGGKEEEEKTTGDVEFIIKIFDNGSTKLINLSNKPAEQSLAGGQRDKGGVKTTSSCKIEFYILVAISCLLGIGILCAAFAWKTKKSQQFQATPMKTRY